MSAAQPSAFARVLRQARLSTYDSAIPQVYYTPPAYSARGDWGLKRALPSSSQASNSPAAHPGALRFVEVSALDTPDGQTEWKEREKETLFVKRWHETGAKLSYRATEDKPNGEIPVNGQAGPIPHTTFLRSTARYPPIMFKPRKLTNEELAKETETERANRIEWERWGNYMAKHAARGVADPSYKGFDWLGEKGESKAFGSTKTAYTTRPRMMPNFGTMSEKQFEKFLDKVRASRKDWIEFFANRERDRKLGALRRAQMAKYEAAVRAQKEAEARGATKEPLPEFDPKAALAELAEPRIDMLEQARGSFANELAFGLLEEKFTSRATSPDSRELPGANQTTTAHPHAGLQYSQPDPIFTNVLAEPLPGRVLHDSNKKSSQTNTRKDNRTTADGRSVALGGHISFLDVRMRSLAPETTDWYRVEPKKGSALFRIVSAWRSESAVLRGASRDQLAPRNDVGYVKSVVWNETKSLDDESKKEAMANSTKVGTPAWISESVEDPNMPKATSKPWENKRSSSSQPKMFASMMYSDRERAKASSSGNKRLGRNSVRTRQASEEQQGGGGGSQKKMFDKLASLVNE